MNPPTRGMSFWIAYLLTASTTISICAAQTSTGLRLLDQQSLESSWFGFNGQNVTSGAVSWVDTDLASNVPKLEPKLLRYPSAFSFWDWKEGWLVNSPLLPSKYANWERKPNYLENFKVVLDSAHADAVLTLNMVTATLQDQLAMLKHADSIGIPVKYVELGSEFYFSASDDSDDGISVIDSIYPTARAYGLVANQWIDSIHHYFPAAKVCVIGSWTSRGSGKKGTWNDSLKVVLNGREDAWSYHVYQPSAWYDSTETDSDLINVELSEVPDWMAQPFNAYDILQISEADANPGKEVWITEFNLNDHARPVQGLWGHGLFNATLSLLYLNDPRITHAICHAMVGSALYGQFFTDAYGFVLSPDDSDFPTMPDPPSTVPWSLTATGSTMETIGEAQFGKDRYCMIDFPSAPQISIVENYGKDTVTYPGLVGALFTNDQGSDAIIINLTGNAITLNIGKLFQDGTYVTKSASPVVPIASDADVTITSGTMGTSFQLNGYTIVKITSTLVPSTPPAITISASGSTEFCEGDSVQLDAGAGYTSCLWSTGERTRKIWAKVDGDYTVKVSGNLMAYAGTATIHVTVHPLPEAPVVTKQGALEFCADKSATLTLSSSVPPGATYVWSTGATTSSITVNSSGTYNLILTDENGCSNKSNDFVVTVHPLPVATIIASGPTTFCDGGSVLLTANPAGLSYVWSSGQTTQSITVDKSTSRTVTVTDGYGCKGTSASTSVTEIVLPNPSITATGPTTYCLGSASTYLSTISGYSYQWKNGSTSISGATQITYTPTVTGSYKVTITDASGCTRATTTAKTITINSTPAPVISTSQSNICNSQTATLTSSTANGWTYQWLKNNAKISGATGSAYTASKAATYNCKTTVTATGCTGTSNSIVITANCRMEEEQGTASVMKIYPNPATDEVHLTANFADAFDGNAVLEVRNLLGQLLESGEVAVSGGTTETTLRLNDKMVSGVYLISVKSNSEFLTEQLIVR